ncbi:MAG: universal stress protein [Bacteroidia bacterium]|nr:universal stress protein [Bacteroidia bacterium]
MNEPDIKKILIPTDFSPASLGVINAATALAKHNFAEITLLHVMDSVSASAPPFYMTVPGGAEYENNLREESNQQLELLATSIRNNGVNKVNVLSVPGNIYTEIGNVSKEIKADLIIMGTHGVSGYKEVFMGSNAQRVVTLSEIPVLTMQTGAKYEFKNILIPIDNSQHSNDKVAIAIKFAEIFASKIHILGLLPTEEREENVKFKIKLDAIVQAIHTANLAFVKTLENGEDLTEVALAYADKNNCDLIVINTGHESQTSGIFMGALAQRIVNHSKIPVLSVIPAEEAYIITTPGFGIS